MSGHRSRLRRADGGAGYDDKRKVGEVGNSLAITIPASAVNDHELQKGDEVGVELTDTGMRVVFPE